MSTKGKSKLMKLIFLLVFCASMYSSNLKAQIIYDHTEFNFTSHQELWRHVIWLQYYETSVSTIFNLSDNNKLKIYGSAFWVNGQSIANNIQGISNIEANRGFEILESWVQFESNSTFSLKFGVLDLNAQFDHIESADFFINPSQGIGPDLSNTGLYGPSIFPYTSLGIEVNFAKKNWELKSGIYDSNSRIIRKMYPEPNYKLNLDEGILFISEYSNKHKNIESTFGVWVSTHKHNDRYPIGEPPLGFGIGLNKISSGIYSHLYSNYKNIDWYLRVGYSNSNTELISKYIGGGIIYKLEDTSSLGVSFGSAGFSKLYKSIFDYRVQNSKHPYEHVIELSFNTLESRFSTQPNLQYIINSKGYKNRNLLFYGIRITLEI